MSDAFVHALFHSDIRHGPQQAAFHSFQEDLKLQRCLPANCPISRIIASTSERMLRMKQDIEFPQDAHEQYFSIGTSSSNCTSTSQLGGVDGAGAECCVNEQVGNRTRLSQIFLLKALIMLRSEVFK